MSKLETNTIDTVSGTTNLTIGSTNSSTVTFESGAVTGHMYPAFMVKLSADQTGVSDDTFTKVQFNSEVFDTDSAYDNSSNYRFTVPSGKAGKYYFTSCVDVDSETNTNMDTATTQFMKNGSQEYAPEFSFQANPIRRAPVHASIILDLSVGDYVEIFCRIEATDSSGGKFKTASSFFGGYRIGT
jgi:hypothetical protein